MIAKNRHYRRSKLSEAKFRVVIRHFEFDLTATECVALSGICVRSINTIYLRIRRHTSARYAMRSPFSGELDADCI